MLCHVYQASIERQLDSEEEGHHSTLQSDGRTLSSELVFPQTMSSLPLLVLKGTSGKPTIFGGTLQRRPTASCGCGSKLNDRRGKPQVLVHVSTSRSGNPFWEFLCFLSHSHIMAMSQNPNPVPVNNQFFGAEELVVNRRKLVIQGLKTFLWDFHESGGLLLTSSLSGTLYLSLLSLGIF